MRPLDPLTASASEPGTDLETLLRRAVPNAVHTALAELDAAGLEGVQAAALAHGHGALALREGRLDDAIERFDAATALFEGLGEADAARVSACEGWLARIRRGPRSVVREAIEALDTLDRESPAGSVARVLAKHYRGTALRYAARPEETLAVLLDALDASDGMLPERGQVLNSLGTLYVVLGAYGAAQAVLEHAADLNHQVGDQVSEAITYGQLGSAALARGELKEAREHLQKQEWFASRVGDNFGQARALTLLGDLAIDLQRPDDAVELAGRAREVASSVTPPLSMWVAYATRTIGRAKVDLRDASASADLEHAAGMFKKMGNQLGEALVRWDQAIHAAREGGDEAGAEVSWDRVAWLFASLGLSRRVAQVLTDRRALTSDAAAREAVDLAIAAAAQDDPGLAAEQEVELVYAATGTLQAIATRRLDGKRNLGRLAALSVAPPGLFVAVVVSEKVGDGARTLPWGRASAALVGQFPGAAVLAWPAHASASEIARDLSSLRAACGDDTRAALGFRPDARVVAPPMAGQLGVEIAGAPIGELLARALGAPPGELAREAGAAWDREAEGLAAMAGYQVVELGG